MGLKLALAASKEELSKGEGTRKVLKPCWAGCCRWK